MKKEEVPQDKGNLSKSDMKELCYATDENGEYTTALSTGWEPKTIALNNSIQDIIERIEQAKNEVKQGLASPIVYFMELHKMDWNILSSYVGMWKWRVKRHGKPSVFKTLNEGVLKKYAEAFQITTAELKNFKGE
ncbi:hypothetical protein [Flavobacterium sp. GT3R68]|uniref:hypothetical protein n=1 Tax=Flavobacterium sp. GT3R68 TaxID=2594437 RepID=UPI000F895115|nr:hypothetical protein [Flavobacterium sp. GT3R68]RTY93922.1 hypothetical protein EKL32_13645 [Flavobacterium sp. GSN2]TRW93463.1 hypothetical protein FNW07_00740 [Flavobacterium sp. GT3R68]